MFESDDFDQVLSQFDFPEVATVESQKKDVSCTAVDSNVPDSSAILITSNLLNHVNDNKEPTKLIQNVTSKNNSHYENNLLKSHNVNNLLSPKHTKRKIINSYFDHQCKRKFPGPAGLLTGALEEPKDDSICQIELLSQDIDCTQHNLRRDLFESPIWHRLLSDVNEWKLLDVDSVKAIKQQALSGNLRKGKAQTVTAFVEAVDRSAKDPLIILRDVTGTIKCTLHRDAWAAFSPYIVSEYCALVLQRPTVLTTGSAFKKHYLNITLSNIIAIYSSAVLKEDNRTLPEGYNVVYDEHFTVIHKEKCLNNIGTHFEQDNNAELLDGLDNIFSDIF